MSQLLTDMQQPLPATQPHYASANDYKLSKMTNKVDDIEAKIR